MRSTLLSSIVLSLSVLAACGGGGSEPAKDPTTPSTPPSSAPAAAASSAAPAAPSGTTTPSAPTPDKPAGFDSLPKEKKVEIMMTKVVPNVGKEFKAYDAKKYEKFGCATCHGPKKDMDPKAFLPKLVFKDGKIAPAKPMKDADKMIAFMHDKVMPTMIDALGEKPFDPATKTGFGCNGCHTVEMK